MIGQMKDLAKGFPYQPLISILTPVYNVKEVWIRKAIESVRNQIYSNWELCLLNDASTDLHIKKVLDEYDVLDCRIKIKHEPQNLGIAGASAQAFNMAQGEFVGLLDHDDELSLDALFHVVHQLNEELDIDILYSDEDKITQNGRREDPFFKPDWSPDLLLSMNYITHFSVFRRRILEECGGFRVGFDGSQDYDLLLRATEKAKKISHIPKILYHWRKIPESAATSTSAKPYAYEAGRRALEEALHRRERQGKIETVSPGIYRVRYRLSYSPLVTIIILVTDDLEALRRCLSSFVEKVTYKPYEIVVVGKTTLEHLRGGIPKPLDSMCTVYAYPHEWNMAAMYNFAAEKAKGDDLVFWDIRSEMMSSDWMNVMVEQAHGHRVGAVGCKRVDPFGQICDAGIVLGIGGLVGYAFKGLFDGKGYYFNLSSSTRNCSALAGECLLVPRHVFVQIKGFDERFKNSLYDIDLCLRIKNQGYSLVWTPYSVLFHKREHRKKIGIHVEEVRLFQNRWSEHIRNGDPYYNANLTLRTEDWSIKTEQEVKPKRQISSGNGIKSVVA